MFDVLEVLAMTEQHMNELVKNVNLEDLKGEHGEIAKFFLNLQNM